MLAGVLSSVELITSGGVCQNIIPDIPSMRWKMISASISKKLIVACGGINFLGDPKTDCWKMEFQFNKPRWIEMKSLSGEVKPINFNINTLYFEANAFYLLP